MKKKLLLLCFASALLGGLLIFNACAKKSGQLAPVTTLDGDTKTSTDENARAEQNFNDIYSASESAITSQSMNKMANTSSTCAVLGGCSTITLDSGGLDMTKWPKKITIDFGSTNCMCNDLRNRRGKLHLKLTGPYRKNGSVLTITTDNYFVNDYQVDGIKTVTNTGSSSDALGNYYRFDLSVSGKIISPDGTKTTTWNSSRTRKTYVGALGIVNFWMISGTASGINSNGKAYSISIGTPLKVSPTCYWITSGTLTITPASGNAITIDYGNGTCDNQATATYMGNTYNITLN